MNDASVPTEAVAYTLRWPTEARLNLPTTFATRDQAQRYADECARTIGELEGTSGIEIVPLYLSPEPRDELPTMLMAQSTARLQNIHELESELARVNALADKLWRLCVEEGWPWAAGEVQDALEEMGLLYPKDMTAEDSGELCESCDGDCKRCFRAVDHVRDAKPQPETKEAKP